VTLNKTITESEKTLKKLETKVKALEQAANQLETIKTSLPMLNTSIPNTGAQYTPITQDIESLAVQTGTQIESETLGPTLLFSRILTPFTPSKTQSVVLMPFSLRVMGNYPAVNTFLSQLLKMERIVNLDSITITRETASKTTEAGVTLNISGNAYYLADEAQLQKALPEKKGRR
jgi:Tfp pilus assembly protein PilO